MKAFFRSLVLWLVLAAISYVLMQAESPNWSGLIGGGCRLLLPPLAAWLTLWAVPWVTVARAGRWTFWAMTLVGWLAVVVLALGCWEDPAHREDRTVLVLAGLLVLLVPVWAGVKARTWPGWRLLGDAAAGAGILAMLGGGFLMRYDAQTRSLVTRAEARWAEIGLPMDAFEQSLAPTSENAGSELARQVLREQLSEPFYKAGTPAAEREPALPAAKDPDLVNRVCEIISARRTPADDLDLSQLPMAALAPHASALEAAYQRILATEPAVWACDPADGPAIAVPSFLALRKFSQLTSAEVLRRFAAGDEEGAARALAAGLRLPEGLEKSPVLVSLMIRVAIEALYAQQQVRLPAAANDWKAIARDTEARRATFLRTMRWEAWVYLRHASRVSSDDYGCFKQIRVLPRWARRFVDRHFMARECANGALNEAEEAVVRLSPATLSLPDGGASLADAISAARPTMCEMNTTRAALRLNATLLLREQSALIRESRAQLAAGRPVEARDSVVFPGARWELAADVSRRTVTTRLVNAPEWIVNGTVTGDDFWLLPLDGSVAWQFRAPVPQVAAAQ